MVGNKFIKIAVVAFSTLLLAGALFGCSSNSDSGSAATDTESSADTQAQSEPQELTPDSELFQIMGELSPEMTLEEANEVIGSEGEVSTESDSSTVYVWDMGDECSIEGTFFTSGSARFDAEYPRKLVKDRANFGDWDNIKAQAEAGTLTYDQLVEMLGGVPGLMDSVRSGGYTYQWYNDDGGYLFAQTDEDGEVSIVSGMF